MSQHKIEKAEYVISHILRWGVLLCALVIAGGWTLSFLYGHGLESLRQMMNGKETSAISVPRSFDEFWFGIMHLKSQVIMAFGLLLLILLPVTRVAAATIIFLIEKDYLFVGMSAFVFFVLVSSLVMGNTEGRKVPRDPASQKILVAGGSPLSLPIAKGIFTIKNYWTSDETTGGDVLAAEISFSQTDSDCQKTSFVQVARIQKADGSDIDWDSGEAPRNELRFKGFYVDHQAAHCQKGKPCSAYFENSWSNEGQNHSGGQQSPATLTDFPFGWTDFEQIHLEACVVCRSKKDILGCVSWGARWPAVGDREIFTPGADEKPSPIFLGALATFQKYYGCDTVKSCL